MTKYWCAIDLGRKIAFFELMGSLVHKLRSVFVGYLDSFLEGAMKALFAVDTKKVKSAKIDRLPGKQGSGHAQNLYLLRLSVVRTLHR